MAASSGSFPFTKMHGIGNDFVVIDELTGSARDCRGTLPATFPPELARRVCDRRFGVGCDQILRLVPARDAAKAQLRMEVLNGDGSQAEMCGNGIRAVGIYLERYWKDRPSASPAHEYRIETLAGLQIVTVEGKQVRVNMGRPQVAARAERLEFAPAGSASESVDFWEASMGNPHAIIFVKSATAIALESWGPAIETHRRFPQRTNVEFVEVLSPHRIRVRVWERGAGITLACGTGACASAVAAQQAGHASSPCEVVLPGGSLHIEWAGGESPVYMTGPAEEVFSGVFQF